MVENYSSFLFSTLSKESIDKERKRHDKAIEDLQRAQIEWAKKRQEQLDYINNQIMKKRKAETTVFHSAWYAIRTITP